MWLVLSTKYYDMRVKILVLGVYSIYSIYSVYSIYVCIIRTFRCIILITLRSVYEIGSTYRVLYRY